MGLIDDVDDAVALTRQLGERKEPYVQTISKVMGHVIIIGECLQSYCTYLPPEQHDDCGALRGCPFVPYTCYLPIATNPT